MRLRRVGAVDEHGAGEGHEPAEKGDEAERALGRDAAVGGEDCAEEEDVEFGLVVRDLDAGPRAQVLPARHDVEADARGQGHGVVEGARDSPLADAVLADEAEADGGEDAVGGAEDQGAVGGEEAGVEGGGWDGEVGEGEEGAGEAKVEGEEAEEEQEDCVHCCERELWEKTWLEEACLCVYERGGDCLRSRKGSWMDAEVS